MAVPGDVDVQFKIGNIDTSGLVLMGCNVYESCIDHHTYADITVLDSNDALGQGQLSGDEEVSINIDVPGGNGQGANFKLALLQNADMKHTGANKAKIYQLRCCSPELLKSRSKAVNKSYNDQTSNIVKDVVENYWGSDKQLNVEQETKGKQRILGNSRNPHEFIKSLHNRHVSQNYEEDGSCFSLFERRNNGEQEIVFTTFKKMMDKDMGIGFEYTQDPSVGNKTTTSGDDYKNIINFNVPASFFTPYRYNAASGRNSYNLASGKQQKEDNEFKDFQLPTANQSPIRKEKQTTNEPQKDQKDQLYTFVDPANDKEQTYITQSKSYKQAMIARLQNDTGVMEVNGNPDITVGKTMKLNIPNKSDGASGGDQEKQITAKVLALRVKHMIKPAGQVPRYTTVVEFMKGGFDE